MDDSSPPSRKSKNKMPRVEVKKENVENKCEVSEEYMEHLEEEDLNDDLSDSQKQYVGVKKEVKTEAKDEDFCQGEGIAGRDPRIDQRIHMMYDQETLKVNMSESESESDSSGESTDEDYERLILECPDLMASVEAERKEKEREKTHGKAIEERSTIRTDIISDGME